MKKAKRVVFVLLCMQISAVLLTGCHSGKQPEQTAGDSFNQGFYQTEYLQESENGYYFRNPEKRSVLEFYDTKFGLATPLCSKPDCAHDSVSCNAFFPYPQFSYSFQYADGYLFKIGTSEKDDSQYALYRISPDGSSREELANLYQVAGEDVSVRFIIHKGSAYYAFRDFSAIEERTGTVWRVPLKKNAEPEEVMILEGMGVDIYRMKAAGDKLYFEACTYEDAEGNGCKGDLYEYDIMSGETKLAVEGLKADFVVVDGVVYGDSGGEITAYNLENGSESKVWTNDVVTSISYDGTYLYGSTWQFDKIDDASAKQDIIVWDKEFREVDRIPLPMKDRCYFGGEGFMFAESSKEVENTEYEGMVTKFMMKVFDKSQIGTGKHDWVVLGEDG